MANTDKPQSGDASLEPSIPYAFYVVREQEVPNKAEATEAAQAHLAEKAAQVAQRAQQAQPVQPVQPIQPLQQVEAVQPIQPVQQVEPVQQPEPVQPVPAPAEVTAGEASAAVAAAAAPVVAPGAPVPPVAAYPVVGEPPVASAPAQAPTPVAANEPIPAASSPDPIPVEAAAVANPAVRPVTLGTTVPPYTTPTGAPAEEDLEAMSAYKTIEARRKRKRRNRIIAACIVGALALGAGGFWAANNLLPGAAPVEEESFEVAYAAVDTFEQSVSASGAIKPVSQVLVTPEVDGIIQEVKVAEGDNVLKGDVLFTLKNDKLDRDIEDAEQAIRTAEHGVTTATDTLNGAYNKLYEAQANYDKVFSTLYETQEIADAAGAEAADLLNAAQTAYDSAQGGLEEAQAAVTRAQTTLEDAKANAEKRTVRAPEGGAIVTMNAEVGASVGAGSGAGSGSGSGSGASSLITIADLSTLRVSVQVNEVDINNLQEGQKAEVTFSALPDLVLNASIERIAAVSSGSGSEGAGGGIVTYDVDLVINEPDPRVKPGMTARVKIITQQLENALTIPVAALQMASEDKATVFVAPGYTGEGKPEFEERSVTVLAQDASMAVVEGKIAEGDAVQLFYDNAGDESGTVASAEVG